MKKFFKENALTLGACFYSLITLLMFLAMRVNYAGIASALGASKLEFSETIHPTTLKAFFIMCAGNIACLLMILAFIYIMLMLFLNKKKRIWPVIISYALSFVFTVLIIVVIILGSKSYMDYILPKFFKSLVISLCIIVFALILFFPMEGSRKSVLIRKSAIMVIVITTAIVLGFDLKCNYFTYEPVVYAVEDEYQIVYSTNDNSTAYVKVGDKCYYDLYAGSMKSKDLVHKISVPQSELDKAGSYTIYATQMLYRGPFGADTGKTISKEYTFKAPTTSDGISYYSVSDVHQSVSAAVNAIKNAGEIDFLVIVGDTTSDVEGEDYANLVNKMAFKATSGSIPVIYARGNHECKGDYSEDLYKYVGSKEENFYYTYTLCNGEIFGIVLDLGEDHDNDGEWWEYYGTDQFNSYRAEQTALLSSLDPTEMASHKYNMVVCHIPIVFVNHRADHLDIKHEWTTILNTLSIDAALYGHQHELIPYVPGAVTPFERLKSNDNWWEDPGTYYSKAGKEHLTDFNFYGYMVGRDKDSQNGECTDHGGAECSGLLIKVDSSYTTQIASWTNTKGEKLSCMNPWTNDEAKVEWTNTLRTK